MYDHRLFARTVSEFVRTLVTPYDVDAVLHELPNRVRDVLDLAGAGAAIDVQGRLSLVTTVLPGLAELERYQSEHQEGPCYEAFTLGRPVAVPDLASEDDRWPGFRDRALAAGIGAVAGIPLRLADRTFGAVNLYSRESREWPEEDLEAASVLADMATGYLINASTYRQQEQLAEQLQHALDARVVIEQAKGVIAEARGIDVEQAFQRIRQHARRHSVRVRDVADAIVHVGLRV
ncbi:ANTAR domain-containing protein [Georgenia sp. AZ-5]|uniref:ANTAR domain-containing protein n=1 Tax=Georgenia sp. AZ-5 TaxID=3367526 RepID=UPI0037545EF3